MYIHSWHEIMESEDLSYEEKWEYLTALRGPDLNDDFACIAKDLFTCLIRGYVGDLSYSGINSFSLFFEDGPFTSTDCDKFWTEVSRDDGGRHWINHIIVAVGVLARFYELKGENSMTLLLEALQSAIRGNHGIFDCLFQIHSEISEQLNSEVKR